MSLEKNKSQDIQLGVDRFGKAIKISMKGQDMRNYHMRVTGCSGTGKTYALTQFASQVCQEGIPVVIIDASDSYLSEVNEEGSLFQYADRVNVYRQGIGLNIFSKNRLDVDLEETEADAARRIAEQFKVNYRLGVRQQGILYAALNEVLRQKGKDSIREKMRFLKLILNSDETEAGAALVSKLSAFLDMDLFYIPERKWDIYSEKLKVFNLQYLDDGTQRVLTDMILWEIWNQAVLKGGPDNKIIVLLDEAQDFNHAGSSPIARMLTQGRKFGIGIWLSTQFIQEQFKKDAISRMGQAALQIYFKPDDCEITKVAKAIDNSNWKKWTELLKELERGECIAVYDEIIDNHTYNRRKRLHIV